MPGDCPKGGYHNWVNIGETRTHVTHECSKCKATNTRAKQNNLSGFVINATAVVFTGLLFGSLAWLVLAAKVQGP